MSIDPILILKILYFIILAVWGLEDLKNIANPDGQVSGTSVVLGTFSYTILFTAVFFNNVYEHIAFLGIGIVLTIGIFIVLRRQLAPLDHLAIAMGNIAFPYLVIPAFIISQAIMKILLINRRQEGHAYLFVYFISFVLVLILESIL